MTTFINNSFHNSCILHDILSMDARSGDDFIRNNPDSLTADENGNITHIIGKKVFSPKNAMWYELEGCDTLTKRENLRKSLLS